MGLERHDLIGRVRPIFGIDLFEPKSGTIEEVSIISFLVDSEYVAEDLANFIDKSVVPDVLDAEPSSGPNKEHQFMVYVEIARNKDIALNILRLLYDTQNITAIDKWHFKAWPKDDVPVPLTPESLMKVYIGAAKDLADLNRNKLEQMKKRPQKQVKSKKSTEKK